MGKRILFFLFMLSFVQLTFAQDDPVLFTVEDTPVHRSEFEYIYSKTNGPTADFSEKSLKEYLDLYVNFKLKVQKAKEMQLDTIVSLQNELAGYRRQLADSYLIDREVTEKLVREAYERSKQDVDISHILVQLSPNASEDAEKAALEHANGAIAKLKQKVPFGEVAMEFSQDKSVVKNKGHIGWVTALFPNGFYALETAAYTGKIGEIQGPIRTSAGYHVLVVNDRRPARGEVEVAHILVRAQKSPDTIKERKRIDEAMAKLKEGADWDDVAKEYSDDKISANKGGYLGFFGINRYEKKFEDAAFALENDGDYTRPVQTSIGWHIIKRISKKSDQTFQQMKSRLQNDVKKDERFNLAKEAMVERIKRESNFTENSTALSEFIASLEKDSTRSFLTYKWKAPANPSTDELFSFGGSESTSLGDFESYLMRSSRKRQQNVKLGIKGVVEMLYADFVGGKALEYEERQLESKYPEFKSLMREYEEGVLLFEVTKMEVWDKASLDTVGLEKFYNENMKKYQWGERAVVSQYSLVEREKQLINQVREFAAANPSGEVLGKFNAGDDAALKLTMRSKTYEKGRNEVLDKMKWEVGQLSPVEIGKRDKSLNFFKIEEILPPGQKTLKEARGYVVADYQDYLEIEWLKNLKDEYDVKIYQKVLKGMVKK